jgi:phospholipase C
LKLAVRLSICLGCLFVVSSVASVNAATRRQPPGDKSSNTTTPIKHVIIVIGENRSFDNLFATYTPADPTQHVWNLLSRNIVTVTGAAGANFAAAAQQQASDTSDDGFLLDPPQTGAYGTLPRPSTTVGAHIFSAAGNPLHPVSYDPGLSPADQDLLREGGIAPLVDFIPDIRFPKTLPNGPFPITGYVKYSATTGDPVHRFYQMWQQIDCHAAAVTPANPSGCTADLYPWVGTTIGWGPLVNNEPPPSPITSQSTWQGSVAMGFYNMAQGDVPYFASLAQQYALSDNYHQFQLGGTGPNSITVGTAAPLVYSDANGNPAVPPSSQVENPNAYPGSNNWYQQEGFALQDAGNTSNAAYTNCSDPTQPGVATIMKLLASQPYKPFNGGNCAPGAYYLLNNQYPAYTRTGALRPDQTYSVGPSSVPTIGDALSHANVSWKWYGEGFSSDATLYSHYCGICNPFQYAKSIMTTSLKNNIQDLPDFYTDLKNGTLPAVSFIKPDDILDGHPGSSLPLLFEAFTKQVVTSVEARNEIWQDTAIFITTDESGGLYDSGYIQPIDFFGDGPRIMLLVVSPYARKGYVDHTYSDHASLLKFIEKNWVLEPLSSTSRDNLPNPLSTEQLPYVPTNSPAVGDLTTMFDF